MIFIYLKRLPLKKRSRTLSAHSVSDENLVFNANVILTGPSITFQMRFIHLFSRCMSKQLTSFQVAKERPFAWFSWLIMRFERTREKKNKQIEIQVILPIPIHYKQFITSASIWVSERTLFAFAKWNMINVFLFSFFAISNANWSGECVWPVCSYTAARMHQASLNRFRKWPKHP